MTVGPISNMDYVVLLCQHIAQTRAFYCDVMKFPLEQERPNWISYRIGSGLLTLRPRGPGLAWHDGLMPGGSASVQLAFRVAPSAVEDWHAHLRANNVEILSPPKDLPAWRHRTLFFRDPEANIIEIYAEI